MLEVFLQKFQLIAEQYMPSIMEKFDARGNYRPSNTASTKWRQESTREVTMPDEEASATTTERRPTEADASSVDGDEQSTSSSSRAPSKSVGDTSKQATAALDEQSNSKAPRSVAELTRIYWGTSAQTLSIPDCRNMVKTLVGGVKSIIWALAKGGARSEVPLDTRSCKRLLRHGLPCLDVFMIVTTHSGFHKSNARDAVRSREEKETLDHFASVYTYLPQAQFKEVFAVEIDFMIERLMNNYALQLICNMFLVQPSTSSIFGSLLVEYLLQHLPEMGARADRGVLHLKLFKLVFQSVSHSAQLGLYGQENEQMLRPHLHTLVQRSTALALVAKEPLNYFMLLRQLFRSIGGGSHDLLYQEFLPLLPALLQQLNRLQCSCAREQMRELFVELCLTVPVRLSSLLPYLPLLMHPLVCALNGSSQLVQQGLRTLELCVDNLQPDYLYEHMAPVRASLMQVRAEFSILSGTIQSHRLYGVLLAVLTTIKRQQSPFAYCRNSAAAIVKCSPSHSHSNCAANMSRSRPACSSPCMVAISLVRRHFRSFRQRFK